MLEGGISLNYLSHLSLDLNLFTEAVIPVLDYYTALPSVETGEHPALATTVPIFCTIKSF